MSENATAEAILDEIKRLATRFERMEGRMTNLDNRMMNLDNRIANLDNRMSNIETVVADLEGRVKLWPDMHYLTAAAKAQLTQTRELKADLAEARVRIDEIYQAMATDPEIKSLREEVARSETKVWRPRSASVRLKDTSESRPPSSRTDADICSV